MTPIQELASKLVPVVEVTLDALGMQLQLFPLRRALDDLQMGMCWLKEANKLFRKEEQESTDIVQDTNDIPIIPKLTGNQPKFETLEESLAYLITKLDEVGVDIDNLIAHYSYDKIIRTEGIVIRLNQVAIRVKEAQFNIELGKTLYEQLRREQRAAEGNLH